MQILPTALASYRDENSGSRTDGADASAFSRFLTQYMAPTPAEVTPSLDMAQRDLAARDDQSSVSDLSPLLAEAPYTASDDEADAAGDAGPRLTAREVREVADNLRRQGADEETVRKVEELAQNPAGASVEDVVRAVAGENPAQLSDVDLQRIESLANQIDPTGELAGPLLENLRNGRVDEAWNLFRNAVNHLDPAQMLSVDQDQLLSLGKALRLSSESLDALRKNFSGRDSLNANLKGLNELLTPVHTEMNRRSEARDKLVGQLENALAPVVKKARKRIEAETAAESRKSRDVQYSETMIRDTATRNGFNRQPGTGPTAADAKKQEKAAEGHTRQASEMPGHDAASKSGVKDTPATASVAQTAAPSAAAEKSVAGEKNAAPRSAPASEKSAEARAAELSGKLPGDTAAQTAREAGTGADGREGARQQAGFGQADPRARTEQAAPNTKNGADNPWDALLQRLDVRTSPGATALNTSLSQASASQMANQTTARDPGAALSSRVLSQVEQGVLSSLRDGSKRLELKLTPVELGTVSVVLTSRKGEVSAILRPERSDTAAMLTQQTDQLRSLLEQQGLKVDKVEVQTQLQDNQNGMTWQGMEQHNESRDRQARSEMLERARRLGRMNGGSGSAPGIAGAGRPGLSGGVEQGLHLVA